MAKDSSLASAKHLTCLTSPTRWDGIETAIAPELARQNIGTLVTRMSKDRSYVFGQTFVAQHFLPDGLALKQIVQRLNSPDDIRTLVARFPRDSYLAFGQTFFV